MRVDQGGRARLLVKGGEFGTESGLLILSASLYIVDMGREEWRDGAKKGSRKGLEELVRCSLKYLSSLKFRKTTTI